MAVKKTISLTVNGQRVEAEVEPRTHLADFLRESQGLTGTNLGCEHGVCGACTLEIDGAPSRSCITYAAGCDGATVRTIEGFDDDPVMEQGSVTLSGTGESLLNDPHVQRAYLGG